MKIIVITEEWEIIIKSHKTSRKKDVVGPWNGVMLSYPYEACVVISFVRNKKKS